MMQSFQRFAVIILPQYFLRETGTISTPRYSGVVLPVREPRSGFARKLISGLGPRKDAVLFFPSPVSFCFLSRLYFQFPLPGVSFTREGRKRLTIAAGRSP